jgi:hypothetical protein
LAVKAKSSLIVEFLASAIWDRQNSRRELLPVGMGRFTRAVRTRRLIVDATHAAVKSSRYSDFQKSTIITTGIFLRHHNTPCFLAEMACIDGRQKQ